LETLVIIPARKGSKGVPNKNKKLLNGKPLIQYTIEAALELFPPENICISTDDSDIVSIANNLGVNVPFIRPSELSSDKSSSYDVLIHALNYYKNININPLNIILLQATSPFRTSQQIEDAIKLYSNDLDMVVSVNKSKSNPYYNLFEENELGFLEKSKKSNFTRRQDCPDIYEYNGAIYIINVNSLKKQQLSEFSKVKKYIMDEYSSHDIDSQFDWDIAELLMSKR
jgi:CMP-N,N'-diacetyllegionaminic acid synthase